MAIEAKNAKIVIVIFLLLAGIASAANPKLFFTANEIPALKALRYNSELSPIWNSIKARADAYCTPSDPLYIDPTNSSWFLTADYGWYGRDMQGYVETIGFVYQITGNSFYGTHGAAILCAAADYVAPANSLLSKNIDMMRTLAVGYDWLASAMTPAQKAKIETVAKEYIEWSLNNLDGTSWTPYHNFTGVAFGGTGLLALAVEDAFPSEAPAWIGHAQTCVESWFQNGFDATGAYVEGHSYMHYGLSNAVAFGHALNFNKQIDILSHPHLLQLPIFLAMTRLPGTDIYEARNDSNFSTYMNIAILYLCQANNSSLLRWLWDRAQLYVTATSSGDGGYLPDYHSGGYSPFRMVWYNSVIPQSDVDSSLPLCEHFTQRGLVAFRSGWNVNATLFTVEAGPYYFVTHNQADKGHFGFYGLGYQWATDLGYRVDETSAHSCILVDGVGQALSAGGGRGTNGAILSYKDTPNYGYVLADATSAYNTNNLGEPGAVVEHALRHSVYVRPKNDKPAYAVIFDDIKKDNSNHTYTWQLLSATNMDMRLGPNTPAVMPLEYVVTPVDATGTGQAVWTVQVPEDGVYTLWGKVRPGGSSISGSDSFYVQVDSLSQVDWHFAAISSTGWVWDKVKSGVDRVDVTFSLTAGTHQIKFKTREAGAQLAAAFLSSDSAAVSPFTPYSTNGIYLEAAQAAITTPMVFAPSNATMQVVMDAASTMTYGYDFCDRYPRLRANCDAVNPKFISFMMPHYNGQALPEVTFSDVPEGRKINIRWPDRYDNMIWTADGVEVYVDTCLTIVPADLNGDCVVDFSDFAIFSQYWLDCTMPSTPDCERAN